MITDAYMEQQKALHAQGRYGVTGAMYSNAVKKLADALGTHDILDYGCGQRLLERGLGFAIRNYDPCIPEVSDHPTYPADIVVCTDVLEHIEEQYVDDVLDDLRNLTRKYGFFTVANFPAVKFLQDGRNAHLIQEDETWWTPKIEQRFDITHFQSDVAKRGFLYTYIVKAKS